MPLHGKPEKDEEQKVFDAEAEDDERPPDEDDTVIQEPLVGEDAAGAPPPVAAEETSNERQYQILVKQTDGAWKPDRVVTAVSKEKALDSIPEDDVVNGGTYRAVPVRSWEPEFPASVEKTTNISFGKK
jgi:hypothetical protein